MTFRSLFPALVLAAACGGTPETDGGDGTGTLEVQASVEGDRGDLSSDMEVRVRRAGVPVTDAVVTLESDHGTVTLVHEVDGHYYGSQVGWGAYYHLEVSAGDDHLDGTIRAPDMPTITAPDPAVALDPHAIASGTVTVTWAEDGADLARVKCKDFSYEGPDTGTIGIPVSFFVETSQELEVSRRNAVTLAGGTVGSTLSARAEAQIVLAVTNPF